MPAVANTLALINTLSDSPISAEEAAEQTRITNVNALFTSVFHSETERVRGLTPLMVAATLGSREIPAAPSACTPVNSPATPHRTGASA